MAYPNGPREDLTVKASPARVGHVEQRQAGLNWKTVVVTTHNGSGSRKTHIISLHRALNYI